MRSPAAEAMLEAIDSTAGVQRMQPQAPGQTTNASFNHPHTRPTRELFPLLSAAHARGRPPCPLASIPPQDRRASKHTSVTY